MISSKGILQGGNMLLTNSSKVWPPAPWQNLPSCFTCVQTNRALGKMAFSSCGCVESVHLPDARVAERVVLNSGAFGQGQQPGSVPSAGSTVLLSRLSRCQGNEPFRTRQVASNSSLVQKPLLLDLRCGVLFKAVCFLSASSWLKDFWSWKLEAQWLESQCCEREGMSPSSLPLVRCCPGCYLSSSA